MVPVTGFLRKELRQVLRDHRMRILLFVVPVIQLTLFGLALSNEVKNVRLASIHEAGDTLTRRIVDHAVSGGWFVSVAGPGADPVEALQSGRADAILVAPQGGLARAIERGNGRLQLLVDATNATRARSVESYLQRILSDVLARESDPGTAPVRFDVRVLYNPSMETALFMVPGVMVMILALVTVLLTSMAIAREKEMGTLEMLIATPASRSEILLGKTIPYVIVAMIDVPVVLGAGKLLFHVPIRGSLLELGLASFFFIVTTVSIGTLISTFARDQQQAMMGGFIFMFPAMLLSGIMFPIENMPWSIQWITYLNPLRHFATLMRNILLKGGDFQVVMNNLAALGALAILAAGISARRFRNTLN